jgi:adenylate kinase
MKELSFKLDLVINLVVSEELIIKRLTNRRVCRKCGANFNLFSAPSKEKDTCDLCAGVLYQRADDNETTIRNRLQVYMKDTQPLINYYGKKGLLRDLAAEKGISDMAEKFNKIMIENKNM